MNFGIPELEQLGPIGALVLALNVIGFFAKKTKGLPNDAIPWILMAIGGGVYPFIADYTTIVSNYPTILAIIYGICLGGMSVGIHQGVSRLLGGDKPDEKPQEQKT